MAVKPNILLLQRQIATVVSILTREKIFKHQSTSSCAKKDWMKHKLALISELNKLILAILELNKLVLSRGENF